MKNLFDTGWILILAIFSLSACSNLPNHSSEKWTKIFDGKTFNGWEGDTSVWHIKDHALIGGSLEKPLDRNYFIATRKNYKNFILKVRVKIIGKEGFANGGVQFRSTRLAPPSTEMSGYQADAGPGWWAGLYDESRRAITLAGPDSAAVSKMVSPNGWNQFKIFADGSHIQIFVNGKQTVDYKEKDGSIPEEGVIGLQIHGGGEALAYYKDIYLKELSDN